MPLVRESSEEKKKILLNGHSKDIKVKDEKFVNLRKEIDLSSVKLNLENV